MALRVLLADESSTIKKVVQLTLQDFDVDVRSVSVGLDVLSVAKTFQPDLVLADVLLAKRSGYEVCHDLKNDSETSGIPVVLMWSGFMEIDEQKARLCGADRRLEKPFDPTTLRNVVKELVHRTLANPVSSYVQFPPLPPFQEPGKAAGAPAAPQTAAARAAPSIPAAIPVAPPQEDAPAPLGVPQVPPDPFAQVSIPADLPVAPQAAAEPQAQNDVTTIVPETTNFNFQNLEPTNVGIAIPGKNEGAILLDDGEPQDEWVQKPPPMSQSAAPARPEPVAEEFAEFPLTPPPQKLAQKMTQQVAPQMPAGVPESVVREEIQKWLATHMAPIAERIIRDEINRLLQDSETTIPSP
ncbi:MAG: response regulator [Bdellovibrionales bacterium]